MASPSHLKRIFGIASPLWPAVITFLGLLAGILGAIYTDEIKRAVPFLWPPSTWSQCDSWSWKAFSFWASALLASLLFCFRQLADDEAKVRAHGELVRQTEKLLTQTNRLHEVVRTLPPPNFLQQFSDLVILANLSVKAVAEKGVAPDAAIRSLLKMIATLAQVFDGDDRMVRYAANIMFFRDTTKLEPKQLEELERRLVFIESTASISKLRGVLDLKPTLSTTAGSEDAEIDDALKPFALPVPHQSRHNNKLKLLPGAPIAFTDKEVDSYSDTDEMVHWCETEGDFTKDVIQQVRDFFATETNVRSFISIPLFSISEPDGEPVGVINVHCNRPGILKNGEAVAQFVFVLEPFTVSIANILSSVNLSEFDGQKADPGVGSTHE